MYLSASKHFLNEGTGFLFTLY